MNDNQRKQIHEIVSLGNINPSNRGMSGNVYHALELAPTLTTGEGSKIVIPTSKQDKSGIVVAGKMQGHYEQTNHVYHQFGVAPTLSTKQDATKILIRESTNKGYSEAYPGDSINLSHPDSKTRRGRVGSGLANTLLTSESQAVVTAEYQIRKLTPRECWRLQGFPDWAFDRASKVNSDSQLYKQAGNSVTVPVIFDIARRLKVVNEDGL